MVVVLVLPRPYVITEWHDLANAIVVTYRGGEEMGPAAGEPALRRLHAERQAALAAAAQPRPTCCGRAARDVLADAVEQLGPAVRPRRHRGAAGRHPGPHRRRADRADDVRQPALPVRRGAHRVLTASHRCATCAAASIGRRHVAARERRPAQRRARSGNGNVPSGQVQSVRLSHRAATIRASRSRMATRSSIRCSTSAIFASARCRRSGVACRRRPASSSSATSSRVNPSRWADFDHVDQGDRVGRVGAVPADAAAGLGDEPAALVVAQRLDVDAGAGGHFTGTQGHAFDDKPVPGYRSQAHRFIRFAVKTRLQSAHGIDPHGVGSGGAGGRAARGVGPGQGEPGDGDRRRVADAPPASARRPRWRSAS